MITWISIITGLATVIRAWAFFNYLQLKSNREMVGFFKYFISDKNRYQNAAHIVPVFESQNTSKTKNFKYLINILTLLIYMGVILIIYFYIK
jgi:hypothetical protein